MLVLFSPPPLLNNNCVYFSHPFAACGSFQIARELPEKAARTNELQQTETNAKPEWFTEGRVTRAGSQEE